MAHRGRGASAAGSSLRELATLAWPIATGMLSETLLGLVDTKLVGGLGPSALGGVGIATMLVFLNYSVVFGVMRAVKVRTAHATGEGRPADGVVYAETGVCLALAWGCVVWALGRDVSGVLAAIGIDPLLVPYGRDFVASVTWGAPATCVLAALVNHRQALGDARTPMAVGIAGNVLNAGLSYALIHGRLGMPALGVRGAGFGTATAEWLEAFAMVAILVREGRRKRGTLSHRKAARELLGIGLPTGLHFGAETIAFTAFTAILGGIGGADMAAHQIALMTIRTSFLPGVAVGEAACILIGRALGRGRLDEADHAKRGAILLAVGFMAACGVVFGLFGAAIASAFTTDAEVVRIARRLLLVAAAFQVLDALNVVLRGALRGAQDVRMTALIGIGSIWLCVPTAAYFLGRVAGLGALGGWLGFIGETMISATLYARRWSHGSWRAKYPEPAREEPMPLSARASI